MENIIKVNPMCKLNSLLENLTISNDLVDKIKMTQEIEEELQDFLTSLNSVKKGQDEVIKFKCRLCVPKNENFKNEVLLEAHQSKYTIHQVSPKCIKI